MKEKATLFIVLLACTVSVLINMVPFLDGKNDLMDFGSFYASGLKLANGENPYDTNSEYIFDITFAKVGAGGKMMNLNPPISAMLFGVLARFDPYKSMVAWQILSAILYAASILILSSQYRSNVSVVRFLWAFSLAGFWHTLVLGQIYILLFFFTVVGWVLLRKGNYIWAGIAIGLLVAIKPNFALWSIFLLLAGFQVTFLASTITALTVSILPLLFHGVSIYSQWLAASSLQPETLIMPGNNSILGLTTRFGDTGTGILISIFITLLLLLQVKIRSKERNRSHEFGSSLGIIASLLASPISWTGYTILLVPLFFSTKRWTLPVTASAVILAFPFQILLQFFQCSRFDFVFFGWLYGWGILLLLGYVLLQGRREDHNDHDHPNELIDLQQKAIR